MHHLNVREESYRNAVCRRLEEHLGNALIESVR